MKTSFSLTEVLLSKRTWVLLAVVFGFAMLAEGEKYGVKPEELLKARSSYREARRVLIEMSHRLNMSYSPLQKLGEPR